MKSTLAVILLFACILHIAPAESVAQGVPRERSRMFIVPSEGRRGEFYEESGVPYFAPPPQERDRRPSGRRMEHGRFEHYDDLAERLVRAANELCLELHYNYAHNRGFDSTYREAYKILKSARSIERKEDRGDRSAVRRSVRELDDLFHHVEGDVQRWRRRPVRQIGRGELHDKIERVEGILHHLAYDVGVTPDHDRQHYHDEAPPPGRR